MTLRSAKPNLQFSTRVHDHQQILVAQSTWVNTTLPICFRSSGFKPEPLYTSLGSPQIWPSLASMVMLQRVVPTEYVSISKLLDIADRHLQSPKV